MNSLEEADDRVVILVDDEYSSVETLRKYLARYKISNCCVNSAKEFDKPLFKKFVSNKKQIAVVDMIMPPIKSDANPKSSESKDVMPNANPSSSGLDDVIIPIRENSFVHLDSKMPIAVFTGVYEAHVINLLRSRYPECKVFKKGTDLRALVDWIKAEYEQG